MEEKQKGLLSCLKENKKKLTTELHPSAIVAGFALSCLIGCETIRDVELGAPEGEDGVGTAVESDPSAYLTSAATGCVPACSAPTPICGSNNKCTSTRWVEPIATLPDKWKSSLDTKVWTKWVRSVVPVVGQSSTQDAALLEVAYFAEKVHMPQGRILVPDLINSMLGAKPTRFSVYPACPKAFMHPSVVPTMSSGGGADNQTILSEDWVLRYPKCSGQYAVACNKIPSGVLCNNCGWNTSQSQTCQDTLAHEHGHTIDLHRRNYLDSGVDTLAKQIFSYNPTEGPAWSASQYFMNPSLETNKGRDRGNSMAPRELDYWSSTQKFTMSSYPAGTGYKLKTARCPQKGLTEPCPDTLTRTYTVPLDGNTVDQCPSDPNKTQPGLCGCGVPEGTCSTCTNTNSNCASWAAAGECTKNPNYMLTSCCAACKGTSTALAAKDFVGYYERTPVLNNWHKVNITLVNNALKWTNAAGVTWSLTFGSGVLKTGSDCPYGVQTISVEKTAGTNTITGLRFSGELFLKR